MVVRWKPYLCCNASMRIFTALTRGYFHELHCEDFFVNEPAGSTRRVVAVLDGCTMGQHSVFAAMLVGKLLQKTAREFYYTESTAASLSLRELLKTTLQKLFTELRQQKNALALETNELLTTLLIAAVDTQQCAAEILAIGDGAVMHDGALTEFDQNDKPDYLDYHLASNFDAWYAQQTQRISIAHFNNLALATDGIFSFRQLSEASTNADTTNNQQAVNALLVDIEPGLPNNMLQRQLRYFQQQTGRVLTDDLAIVRLIETT